MSVLVLPSNVPLAFHSVKPAVCIPWFDSGNPERKAACNAVLDYWAASAWPTFTSNYALERATARNEAAHAALALGHDLLVFCDADTIPVGESVEAAVKLAAESPGLVYAYDLYIRLSRPATEKLIAAGARGEWPLLFERQYFNAPSIGCVALSAETYTATGGLDESYKGWGYEDLAFVDACQEVAPVRRVSGPVFHLWHGERYADEADALAHGATVLSAPLDADVLHATENRHRWLSGREMQVGT